MNLTKLLMMALMIICSMETLAFSEPAATSSADLLITKVNQEGEIVFESSNLKMIFRKTQNSEIVLGELKIEDAKRPREVTFGNCSSNEIIAHLMQCQNDQNRILISVSIGADNKFRIFIVDGDLSKQVRNQLMIPRELLSQH